MNNINFPRTECDSRKIRLGDTFAAISGEMQNGNAYIPAAIAAGAREIISELNRPSDIPKNIKWTKVRDARFELARRACAQADNPSHKLKVFAITGTNGKTTTANLLRAILTFANYPCGLLSTIGNSLYPLKREAMTEALNRTSTLLPASNTTPGPIELQDSLSIMHENGCSACVMEVSSHALIQKRCYGTKFEGVAFTNLTQDHLDYHKTMEEYFKAKSLLFLPPQAPAVVNIDCKFGQRLANQIKQFGGTVLTYGAAETADLCFSDAKLTAETTNFTITYKNQSHNVALMLLGRHNIYNALAAIGLALNAGIDLSIAIKAIQQEKPVRGRLEHVKLDSSKANFYVDYAHTPDAIENVLRTLREITDGRLFIVFGAGGDRDRRKRPLMGKAAFNNADYLIITSDNPRSEQPSAIIEDILEGIPGTGVGEQPPSDAPEVSIIEDRREAIAYAVKTANQSGDVVLIAGKGHEDYQIFADHTEHFDDIEELKAAAL